MSDPPARNVPAHMGRLHPDEVDIDVDLVRGLVTSQFPEFGDVTIRQVSSTGTVNAIYRLGDRLYARMPRGAEWVESLETELTWLPVLASRLTLPIPKPVARGRPDLGYPFPWGVFGWIDGEVYTDDGIEDERRAARDLARFILELRRVEPSEVVPSAGRQPLADLDHETRTALRAARGVIDSEAAVRAWDLAREAPVWEGTPVWIHADLLRPNLLVDGGRLSAVIDFGGAGIGDPATDVIAAWSVFGPSGREAFRHELAVEDGTYLRARGIALHQAALIIPYYRDTNPEFVSLAKRTVEQILADVDRERGA